MTPLRFISMDAVALARSDEAEIHDILDSLTPDTRKSAEQLLANLGFPESSYDPAVQSWAQARFDALTEDQKHDADWRWFYDEPKGCRSMSEVA